MPLGRKLLIHWGPALSYMALIWWVSSRQVHVPTELFPMRDKGIHFVEYTTLGVVLARATLGTWPQVALRAGITASIATFCWGLLDELHQAFVPGRTADPFDLMADAVGALCGVLLFGAVWAFWRRRRHAASEAGGGCRDPS